MSETVRAFIAIELSDEIKQALAALVDSLRDADIPELRLVHPEGIHLTIKFLGEVPTRKIPYIVMTLKSTIRGQKQFPLRLGSPGHFPARSNPRVLWVGVDGDLDSLRSLHNTVEEVVDLLGFDREARGFNPHMTVGRIRERTPPTVRRRAKAVLLDSAPNAKHGMTVSGLSLMQSTLTPDGPLYDRLAWIPLEASDTEEPA